MKLAPLPALALALLTAPLLARNAASEPAPWSERVALSGSADLGFVGGGRASVEPDDGFAIWDTRVFVDAELGRDLALGSQPVVRNLGFTFEWNVVRRGALDNDVGLAYLDLEGLAASPWLNLRVGRFQIPFGEAYLLYSKGYATRSFFEQPLGGPWWWDEGALLHGSAPDQRFGYVVSITNGDTGFNDVGGDVQLTGKLWGKPWPFLSLSASGLWTSALARVDGALWLGESWARPLGSGTEVSNWSDGTAIPDDPDGLGHTWAVGLDAIATPIEGVRIWLSGGRFEIESRGASTYDRVIWYWLGEIVLGGRLIHPALDPLFAGLRVDGLGTLDPDRGYLLDVRYGSSFGYDMERFLAETVVLGWRLGEWVTLRAEYSHRDVELVRGARADVPGRTGNEDRYTVAFGLHY